jgi:KDO2-lipid IV(A) lauroyltransferase
MQHFCRFRNRKIVLRNFQIALGDGRDEGELRQMVKNNFSNFARAIFSFLRMPHVGAERLSAMCNYDGFDDVVREVKRGGGFIVAGPHLGAWEVGGACISALGVRVHTVAFPHPSIRTTHFFDTQRMRVGLHSYPIGRSYAMLVKALRAGEAVALLIDRAYGPGHTTNEWFGTEVELPIGHIALAARCEVPIVTAACVLDGSGYRFVYGGPYYPGTGDEEALKKLQNNCLRDMERFIRDNPEQWFNYHPLGDSLE